MVKLTLGAAVFLLTLPCGAIIMGGLFGIGGKKNLPAKTVPAKSAADSDTFKGKSRKIIAAGGTKAVVKAPLPTKPIAQANPAAVKSSDKTPLAAPTIASKPRSAPAPEANFGHDIPGLTMDAGSLSTGPVVADTAAPPAFGGSITSGLRRGPSRSGDSALIEFLAHKSNPALLTAEQIQQVKAHAQAENLAFDESCVRLGFFTEAQLVAALTQECWVPHLKLDKYEIRKKALDTISAEDAAHYGVFPVDKLGSLLTLAMVNPLDQEALRSLEHKTGLDIKKVVATRSEIAIAIEKYYTGSYQAKDASRSFVQDVAPRSVTQMMSKVSSASAPAAAVAPVPEAKTPTPFAVEAISAEILDIEDLLAAEVEPATIAPLTISAEPAGDDATHATETSLELPEIQISPVTQSIRETSIPIDLPTQLELEPMETTDAISLPRQPRPSPTNHREPTLTATAALPDPEAALVPNQVLDTPLPQLASAASLSAPPVSQARVVSPPTQPASTPPPIPPITVAPAAKSAAPSTVSTSVRPNPAGKPARSGVAPTTSATSRFQASQGGSAGLNELIPITEDEFKYAISHGRSNVFERWTALQSRNRIINGVPLGSEIEQLLSPLFK